MLLQAFPRSNYLTQLFRVCFRAKKTCLRRWWTNRFRGNAPQNCDTQVELNSRLSVKTKLRLSRHGSCLRLLLKTLCSKAKEPKKKASAGPRFDLKSATCRLTLKCVCEHTVEALASSEVFVSSKTYKHRSQSTTFKCRVLRARQLRLRPFRTTSPETTKIISLLYSSIIFKADPWCTSPNSCFLVTFVLQFSLFNSGFCGSGWQGR